MYFQNDFIFLSFFLSSFWFSFSVPRVEPPLEEKKKRKINSLCNDKHVLVHFSYYSMIQQFCIHLLHTCMHTCELVYL